MKLYRAKQKYVAWQVNFNKKDEPDWLKTFIEAGAIYYQGGSDPYYTVDRLCGSAMMPYAHAGDWILTVSMTDPDGLSILSDRQFKARYELVEK